ncbi:MAG TPA: HAMP domain-containing sensor histidine kinase [Aestuariivirgaceae bacterium]|jgi:signal transduction histidine kinase
MIRLVKTSSFKLAAVYAAVTLFAFLTLFVTAYLITTRALDRQIRFGIQAEYESLISAAKSGPSSGLIKEISERVRLPAGTAFFYFLSDESGRKLAGNLNDHHPTNGWQTIPISEVAGGPSISANADDHRLTALGGYLPDRSFLLVGDDSYRLYDAQEAIMESFALASGLVLALSILPGMIMGQTFLRRIDSINITTQAIVKGQLKERIPLTGHNDELDELSRNVNRMLDSNQSLMESLRQVSSSIAHDLRTPLSRLRQNLEEVRFSASRPAELQSAIDQAIVESETLLSTFSALLRISQVESKSRRSGFKVVYLSGIFEKIVEAYGPVIEETGKTLNSNIATGVSFVGDEELLTQLLANLVENAIKHTPTGAEISVSLQETDVGLFGCVADNGIGIPEVEHKRVFERFYRLDRSRTTSGSGLGLSLVGAIADLHAISISLQDNRPGLRVILGFPRPPPD